MDVLVFVLNVFVLNVSGQESPPHQDPCNRNHDHDKRKQCFRTQV